MEPQTQFGKFTRTKLLGAGGMGEVWKAWDGQLGRWVALKFLKGGSAEDVARFQREAQIASRLSHPNIAAIYEVGREQGQDFIAMQFIEGVTLKKLRADRPKILKLIRDAARAVHFAHEKGIVHRDLKPDNFMVTKEGHVFVMDFGLARPTEGGEQVSAQGVIVGTPAFMAPEQAQGLHVDERVDVYGLGATLYDLVTRHKPFDAASTLETLVKVVGDEVRSPRSIDPSIDPDLETLVLKCLEKEPARRYASAEALAADLERHLEGEPISAHAPSALYRLLKLARRRKPLVAFAVVVAIVIAVGVGFLLPAMKRDSAARLKNEAALSVEKGREEALKELGSLWTRILLVRQGLYRQSEDPAKVMGGLRQAVESVGGYIGAHPEQPQGYYVRARGELYLNDLVKAEADLRKAVAIDGGFGPGHALLGRVLLERFTAGMIMEGFDLTEQSRRRREAEPLLIEAKEHFLSASADIGTEARWGLIRTREDDVAAVVARAVKIAFIDGAHEAAMRVLQEEQAARPSEEFCHWLGRLDRTMEGQLEWTNRALAIMPHWSIALCDRGTLHIERGDLQQALEDLSASVRIDPYYALAWYNRGILRTSLKDFDGAVEDYTRAVEVDPKYVSAWCNRGSVRQVKKDFEGAMADFSHALEIDPDDWTTRNNRGVLRTRLADYRGALEDLDRAIQIDPRKANAYHYRGVSRANLGNFEGAVADYTKAVELDPKSVRSYTLRGAARRQLNDTAGAIEDCTKALEIDPRYVPALSCRGGLYVATGNLEAAIEDLKKALELDPNLAEAWGNLGMAYNIQRDYATAKAAWLKALEVAPPGWSMAPQVEAWLKALAEK